MRQPYVIVHVQAVVHVCFQLNRQQTEAWKHQNQARVIVHVHAVVMPAYFCVNS